MIPRRKPAKNRAPCHRFTAGTPTDQAEFLRARLESLINGLRLFAAYCDLAPNPFRSEIKQFVDLAEIELSEGYKTLHNCTKSPSTEGLTSEEVANSSSENPSSSEGLQQTTASFEADYSQEWETECTSSNSSPSLSNSELNPVGLSYDTMAQMAVVPEANDLDAILARLKSTCEATDSSDIESLTVGTQPGRDAREILLGFDVCRLDSNPSEASPEQAAESQPVGAICDLANKKVFAASSDATSITTLYTEVIQLDSNLSTAISSVPLPTAEDSNSALEIGNLGTDSKPSENPSSETTQEENTLPEGGLETGSETYRNPNSSRESKSEQSENSNPVNSISPDNLLEINALKEELDAMLSQFKSFNACSSSS